MRDHIILNADIPMMSPTHELERSTTVPNLVEGKPSNRATCSSKNSRWRGRRREQTRQSAVFCQGKDFLHNMEPPCACNCKGTSQVKLIGSHEELNIIHVC